MILSLFLSFLKIGALSFGGGYGMIAVVRETVLAHGWLSEEEFLDFIAVSESTPGPLAVNMATFVGSSQAGFLGALVATLGVILPSFFLLLLIAALIRGLLKYAGVQAFLGGLRPAVVALILGTACLMILSNAFGIGALAEEITFDLLDLVLFLAAGAAALLFSLLRKKAMPPLLLILLSAGFGLAFSALWEGI